MQPGGRACVHLVFCQRRNAVERTNLLEVEHLSVHIPSTAGVVQAVRDVSFAVAPGEVLALVGESGCGKSILCKSVMGLLPKRASIVSGAIRADGRDITNCSERELRKLRGKLFSMVFQDPMTGTAATMNIEENMALAMRRGEKRTLRWGISNMERDMYREQLRTLGLGLEERMSSKVGLLSGGQRQALTLLMAALRTPKLLLLDEHTAALDPKTAAKVLELTEKIVAEQKLTAMMVTHNMKDAIAMGNRLIMMNAGRIVVDVRGEEKKKLTREDLMQLFEKAAGQEIENDRMLLS